MQPFQFSESESSAVLRIRIDLATALRLHLMTGRIRRADLARVLNVPQHRVTDLLRGNLTLFSLDDLIVLSAAAGLTAKLSIQFN